MVDCEKVIKGFECCSVMMHDLGPEEKSCGICPYKDVQTEEQIDLGGIECIAALHDDALALLKEQEPLEPIYNEEKYGDYLPRCGKCEETLPSNTWYGKVNFCHCCGQAVKWDE